MLTRAGKQPVSVRQIALAARLPWEASQPRAPLVAPVPPPPISFLEDAWVGTRSDELFLEQAREPLELMDEEIRGGFSLAMYIDSKCMKVTYVNDMGDMHAQVQPLDFDGIDSYFERMLNVEVKVRGEFCKIYSVGEYEPFAELIDFVTETLEQTTADCLASGATTPPLAAFCGHVHAACHGCAAALDLCHTHGHMGTYGFANLLMERMPTVVGNMEKAPCTCGIFVANRILGIVIRLVDGTSF